MATTERKERKPVDYPRLRELIDKARGDRTLRQYAADAGVDHAVLYKIMNSDEYKPGYSVLQRLASDEANPQGGVHLVDLMTAAGFPVDEMKLYSGARATAAALTAIGAASAIPVVGAPIGGAGMFAALSAFAASLGKLKRPLSEKEQAKLEPELANYMKVQNKFKVTATGILFAALASKGIIFQPGNMQNVDTFGFRPDDYINILDQEINSWWFKFGVPLPNKEGLPIPYSDQANAIIQQIITAKPDPKRKVSFVVEDPKTFAVLKQYAGHNSYRGNLSVILIDTENVTIRDEALLSTYDETTGEDPLSIL